MTAIAANTPLTHTACACAHCGLPVPSHEMRAADPTPFCCSGCRAVWHSLHDAGLAAYYELAARVFALMGFTAARAFGCLNHCHASCLDSLRRA